MQDITSNEASFILTLFKHPEVEYNANSIAKVLGITSMGALKIAKQLEKEEILVSKQLGRAIFYKLNVQNDYVIDYLKFLLKRESMQALPYIRRWVNEIKKIKSANAAILFGSVLKKRDEAKDIDVLVLTDKKGFSKLKKEIEAINLVNDKKLHPLFQTEEDLIKNIKSRDNIVLNAIKGIAVFGEDKLISLLEK